MHDGLAAGSGPVVGLPNGSRCEGDTRDDIDMDVSLELVCRAEDRAALIAGNNVR